MGSLSANFFNRAVVHSSMFACNCLQTASGDCCEYLVSTVPQQHNFPFFFGDTCVWAASPSNTWRHAERVLLVCKYMSPPPVNGQYLLLSLLASTAVSALSLRCLFKASIKWAHLTASVCSDNRSVLFVVAILQHCFQPLYTPHHSYIPHIYLILSGGRGRLMGVDGTLGLGSWLCARLVVLLHPQAMW